MRNDRASTRKTRARWTKTKTKKRMEISRTMWNRTRRRWTRDRMTRYWRTNNRIPEEGPGPRRGAEGGGLGEGELGR